MTLVTGFQIPFGVQPINPLPVDTWSGPYVGTDETTALALANSSIPSAIRFRTMEVRMLIGPSGGETSYKYWYYGGTADSDLVPFGASGATGPSVAIFDASGNLLTSGATGLQFKGTVNITDNGDFIIIDVGGATGATGAQVGVFDSAGNELTAGATGLKFTGAGVSISNTSDFITVDIPGVTGATGPSVAVYDQNGNELTTGATGIKFGGTGVNVTQSGDFITVSVQGATGATGQSVAVFGTTGELVTAGATGIRFIGTGVTVYASGDYVTVGISGGSIERTAPLTGDGSSAAKLTLQYTQDFNLDSERLALNLDFSTLVTPVIVSNWSVRKYDNSTPFPTTTITRPSSSNLVIGSTLSSNAITLPNGSYCDFGGTASCPAPGSGQVTPQSTSGTWIWNPDPPVGGNTSVYTDTNLVSNTSYSTSFATPNTGLRVQNNQVVRATGSQTTTASVSVTFDNVFYWGTSNWWGPNNDLSQAEVDALTDGEMADILMNLLTGPKYQYGGKSQTMQSVTTSAGTRLVFAYPQTLGLLTAIATVPPSAPYIGAFRQRSVTSTNFSTISGLPANYYVYVGVSDNNFNGVTLTTQ